MLTRAQGMLAILTDIPDAGRAEFDRWYDREHLAERVAIPGFLGAARYLRRSGDGLPEFAAFYPVERFEVLDSEAYRAALKHQTEWSKAVMAQFRNTVRCVARVTARAGAGTGAALAVLRLPAAQDLDPAERRDAVAAALQQAVTHDGVVAGVLLENDPELSRPLPEQTNAQAGFEADGFVLLEGTSDDAVAAAMREVASAVGAADSGAVRYTLLWQLADGDL